MVLHRLLFGVFFFTLIISAPIFFSLGLSALALLWNKGMLVPQLVVQRMFAGVDSFPMMAIPFFMLAGALMDTGRDLQPAGAVLELPGGLDPGRAGARGDRGLHVSSPGSPARPWPTPRAIGSTLIPLMKKRGFPKLFSASVVAAAGVVGPIIPPSIPMVIYGVMAGVSIGALFMGGFIPGILIGLGPDGRGLLSGQAARVSRARRVRPTAQGVPRGHGQRLRGHPHAADHPGGDLRRRLHGHRGGGGGDRVRLHHGEVRVQGAAVAPSAGDPVQGRPEHGHDPDHRGGGEPGRLHHGSGADPAHGGGAVPGHHRPTSGSCCS